MLSNVPARGQTVNSTAAIGRPLGGQAAYLADDATSATTFSATNSRHESIATSTNIYVSPTKKTCLQGLPYRDNHPCREIPVGGEITRLKRKVFLLPCQDSGSSSPLFDIPAPGWRVAVPRNFSYCFSATSLWSRRHGGAPSFKLFVFIRFVGNVKGGNVTLGVGRQDSESGIEIQLQGATSAPRVRRRARR